ncbi:hypothetical protein [Xanthocytophaga agilis]|uniref:Uncharacterized protein n=1 Tax=Xanthocytophaga agilis TaxID=3048010 RepID=A0AAE3R8Q8_9BACT|nr:hypothetical protein [Xanthocytophaga agilis]MDJ1505931.1 hypothetical protein [Xanthocytophaga agilis]
MLLFTGKSSLSIFCFYLNKAIFTRLIFLLTGLFFTCSSVWAQSEPVAPTYPKVMMYMGVLHPLVTFSDQETVINFDTYYAVGFPTGVNLWKSSKIGFSIEVVPLIRADKEGSKMNNLLFHPGVLVGLGKGFMFAGRAAFETSGRYGFTPVLNKVFKTRSGSYFIAMPLPVRFGNNHSATFTIGLQFGVVI